MIIFITCIILYNNINFIIQNFLMKIVKYSYIIYFINFLILLFAIILNFFVYLLFKIWYKYI